MLESLIDWYWQFFALGSDRESSAAKLAALYSWLMLFAAGLSLIRLARGKEQAFFTVSCLLIALSYATTDILLAGFNNFYLYFDGDVDFRAISLSYTLFDSFTAIFVMLVVRSLCHRAHSHLRAVDMMVAILLYNGAAHFLANGYYVILAEPVPPFIAMLYSATIVVNDALLVALMFFPSLANRFYMLRKNNTASL